MADKRKAEVGFSWADGELQLLFEASLDFKSKCEFQVKSWESKGSKYRKYFRYCVKRIPQAQKKEKLDKDRVAAKLKNTRTSYRKVCDNGRKSEGGRTIFTF